MKLFASRLFNHRVEIIILCLQFPLWVAWGQADVAIGNTYQLNLQRKTANESAYILHNAKVDATSFKWETTHGAFGSRGLALTYYNGIEFFADDVATTAGATFTPSVRMTIRPDGNIGIGTSLPRGKFDVDGAGDIFLADDVNTGTTQSIFFPGHVYLSPYNGSNVSYLQARRFDNSGTTSLRLRTYNNGSLVESMHLSGNGSVGVGTVVPDGFQINTNLSSETSAGVNNIRIGVLGGSPRIILDNSGSIPFEIDNAAGRFRIYTPGVERFTITSSGNVGIGTTDPGSFKLAVEGKIGAREVNVMNDSPWPDYVFEESYSLPSLSTLEQFIKKNKRLPDVPSAEHVKARGINLGEINTLLLKKIEELTLHLIEKENQLQALDERIKKLEED